MKKLITISTSRGYEATLATPTDIPGRYWLHRATDAPGWVITEETSGRRVCRGKTAKGAIAMGHAIISSTPPERVAAVIRAAGLAPDPSTVDVAPPRPAAPARPDLDAIVRAIRTVVTLSEPEAAAVRAALSPVTGRLRSRRPAGLAGAAWNGMQPNPWKVSVFSLVLADPAERALFDTLSRYTWPACLDTDAHKLQQMGVWP